MHFPEMEELNNTFSAIDALEEQMFQMNTITANLQDGKVDRSVAEMIQQVCPEVFNANQYPINSFTLEPSYVNADVIHFGWGKVMAKVSQEMSTMSLRSAVLLMGAVLWLLGRLRKRLMGSSSSSSSSSGSSVCAAYAPPTPNLNKDIDDKHIQEFAEQTCVKYALFSYGLGINWPKLNNEIEVLISDMGAMLSVIENIPTELDNLYEKYKDVETLGTLRKASGKSLLFTPDNQMASLDYHVLNSLAMKLDQTGQGEAIPVITDRLLKALQGGTEISKFAKELGWTERNGFVECQNLVRKTGPNIRPPASGLLREYRELVRMEKGTLYPVMSGNKTVQILDYHLLRNRRHAEKVLSDTWGKGKPLTSDWLASLKVWNRASLDKLEGRVEEIQTRLNKLLNGNVVAGMNTRYSFLENQPMYEKADGAFRPTFPAFSEKNIELDERSARTPRKYPASPEWALSAYYCWRYHKELSLFLQHCYVKPMRVIMNCISRELETDEYLNKRMGELNILEPK